MSRTASVRTRLRPDRHQPAYPLLVAAVALLSIGIVMVYSASSVWAVLADQDAATYGIQQAIWAALGLTAMWIVSRLDFRVLRYLAIPGFVASIALLAVVLVPGIGTEISGSRRWIVIPGIGQMQPAELAKLATVIYLAHWLDRRGTAARSFWNGIVPFGLLVAPGFALILAEPDMGSAGIYVAAALAVFFMAGANIAYLAAIFGSVLAIAFWVVSNTPYQLARIEAFLDPWRDPLRSGYNTLQALMALALGGVAGLGLGASRQKYLYLPAPSTDFIFAIIGEEWGLIGTLTVLTLFCVIAYQGYRIAITAPDTFSGLLAAGITTWLVGQAFINMMVVSALLPITGIPLPLISYGGSALTVNLVAIGILLSISRETTQTGSLRDAVFHLGRRDRRPHLSRAGGRSGPQRRAAGA
ncbi:MAG: putative lipid II flippase FtsW [Chloroflexota bacterium]|nr:putative lipid II flippase FtsW [Chloroflexota bacterium]